MTNKYQLDIEKIKRTMKERGISVKDLVEGSDITEKRMEKLLSGYAYKRTPLIFAMIFCSKLNLRFEDLFL